MKAFVPDEERIKLVTFYDYTLETGEVVKLTSNFWALTKLRAKNLKAYDRYNELVSKSQKMDIVDMVSILYCCYLCACNLLGIEAVYDEETFILLSGNDYLSVGTLYGNLISPKKPTASGSRSDDEPEKGKAE